MEPMYLSIRTEETGQKIKKLLLEKGYTVRDIQDACGFENPQAIYKWISGRSLPSLDNFVILSKVLHTSIEDILVIDGDIVHLWGANCKVYFFGHSLSKTDGDKISEMENLSLQMIIYYKDQEDYENKVINLINIFGKKDATEKIRSKKIIFMEIN